MTALRHEYPYTSPAGDRPAAGQSWPAGRSRWSASPGSPVAEALVLAVILAPTDAALGQSVVSDDRLPSVIRPGAQRRVRPERRALRTAPVHRDRPGRHRGRRRVDADRAQGGRSEAIGYGVLSGILAGAIGGLLLRYVKCHNLAEQVWLPAVPVGIAAISFRAGHAGRRAEAGSCLR